MQSRRTDPSPRTSFSATTGGPTFGVGYTYDGASRLATVVAGADTSAYGYLADSSLIGGLTTTRGGVTSLAITSCYDKLERLTAISASNGTSVVSSHAYSYNDLNQRVDSMLEDGSKWHYLYDDLGQVIAGNKQWADNAPVAGSQFGYAFDGIGNRTSATVNGRIGSYAANTANQYTQRQVPGFLDIRGTAIAASKVTVNRQATQRQGDTFYKAYAVDNSAAAQFPEIKVLAVQNNAGPNGEDLQSQSIGKMFLPQTPEMFTYDAEGNLASDGRWNYTWDAENRLIQQEALESVPSAARRKLEYAYDSSCRRVRKQVWHWNGTAWALDLDRRFLYDGWNLVAELDSSNTILRNYVWGTDLSGTIQGAGGVGGLLTIREGTECYHPAFDGNGNVTALVKASDHSIAARYQYGPFGETLVVEENGVSNPFRFSTKYCDAETGLYYYGFRYYDPVTGRWPSRDPIEEKGGVNLYGFVGNHPTISSDRFGLYQNKDEALNAARDAVGIKSSNSRITGLAEVEAYLPKPPYVFNPGPMSGSDAVLYWLNEPGPDVPRFSTGVAGVEYSATVFCCPNRLGDHYGYRGPLRGKLPSRGELIGGLLGSVEINGWPDGCNPVAFIHSHTMTQLFVNNDGALSSSTNFLPNNGGPDSEDLAIGRNAERYLVHEYVGVYFLVKY